MILHLFLYFLYRLVVCMFLFVCNPAFLGLRRGDFFLAPPYDSQRAVFASLWALFHLILVLQGLTSFHFDKAAVRHRQTRMKMQRARREISTASSLHRKMPFVS